ncbi:M14 family zinc carboxypeptidase [Flavobacterium sp.]|uniref:M14 family zinc carboxypeptidase n=1 Tax=Flavobacterium sp. TaxID=239 RepID=UPI0031E226F7
MIKKLYAALFLVTFTISAWAQLKSPSEFIPNYGKQISYYHEVENYFDYLTENSALIKKQKYGMTNEQRDLNLYFISSTENLKNLEQIRINNLASIGLSDSQPAAVNDKIIVWLSFNVHGNEFAGTESAMTVAYELLNPSNETTKQWLQNTVVILDPCINPDGYSRYGNWLREISGKKTHPGLYDREHMEVWPGGRYNHYLFDLNRDWAWQTQIESQQRIKMYNQWMPQVHTDVHEMSYNSPYFFPPAAEPLHEFIEQYQKDFHNELGKNISQKFDKQNWMYNTRERFDLFYPSYGDTYPTYNGAVGLTLEQGGIGAGREVTMENGVNVTIKDRLTHHATAVLTVVESAAAKREILLKGIRDFHVNSRKKAKGIYNTYVLKSNPKLEQLTELLKKNDIEFSYADASAGASGFHYQNKKNESFKIEPNDLIIKADQPRSVLAQVLFEPNQKLNDSLSYDITAWALPLAYGIEGYAVKNNLSVKTKAKIEIAEKTVPASVYAFYVPWNNRVSVQVLSALHQADIKVRSAMKKAVFGELTVEPGGLIISRADNPKLADFEKTVSNIVKVKTDYTFITTGFSTNSKDIGSENFKLLKAPKVLMLSGKGIVSTEFGANWFYFDETISYPISIVEVSNLNRVKLYNYNTLILSDGTYDLSEDQKKEIDGWIKNGGKVIAMSNAISLFEDREGYALSLFASKEDKEKSEKEQKELELKKRFLDFEGIERRGISGSIPGAIIENKLDKTYPLAFGLGNSYFSLKSNERSYSLLKNATNAVYIPKEYISYGFVGNDIKKKLNETVSFAVEKHGDGNVIYMMDNPLFRGFWENGILLFSNSLFLVH